MSKNQSIKSFFTSSQNLAKKANSSPVKKTENEVKKDIEEIKTVDEKENNDTNNKKKVTAKSRESSPELVVTKSDSSSGEDSPIVKKSSNNNSKRKKLAVQSSSSEEEEPKNKKEKKADNSKLKEKESPKAKVKEALKLKESDSPKSKAKESPKPKAKDTPKSKTKESPKSKAKTAKSENLETSSKTESENVENSKTQECKETEKPIKEEKVMQISDSANSGKTPVASFFSKSTSNFSGGKKVENTSSNKESTSSGKSITSVTTDNKNEYAPNKDNYHPIKDAVWEKGQPVPYSAFAQTLYCMEQTTKRLELLSIVTNYFRSVLTLSPKDLVPSIYMLTNKVAPDYDSLELGIGDTVLFKALGEATGCTAVKLKTEFQNKGDIGLVAESNRCTQKLIFAPKKLTVGGLFAKLREIASITGNSSQNKKVDLIKSLLVCCNPIEARYLMRMLAGKLRNGLGEQSILTALGHACAITPPVTNSDQEPEMDALKKIRNSDLDEYKKVLEESVQHVKHAYNQCPNYDRVVEAITKYGVNELEKHCKLSPGVPLKPMLAYPTKGLHEVIKRFDTNEFTCEYKYDGERAQIHILDDGSIQIYSRNSENNTSKYPDIIEFLQDILKLKPAKNVKKEEKEPETSESLKVVSAIIDAEVVAYDIENKVIKPFQVLTTRKRKDVNAADITIQVCIFAFDLLYLNSDSLIDMTFRKRRELLYKYFPHVESKLMFAVNMNSNNLESIQEFLDNSIKDGCEGLMVKTLDVEAHYEISKRSHNWLKLKKDYLDGVGDTLDLVVIGGYLGTGKRTGVYGGYLLAVYEPGEEEYQTICKLGTGLKDDDLQVQFESLSKIKIDKPKSYYRVNDTLEQPDHWFEPEQVWEIKCADFSISPVHTAAYGLIDPAKGVSMRFPRFLRLRDDKKPEDATTSEQLAEMYKNQQQLINQNQNAKKSNSDEEEDNM